MREAGNPPKTKTGGFPASLESAIPPRFPHSHRPCGCYIGFKIQGPKAKPERRSLSSAPVPFPFRLILQLEKTVGDTAARCPSIPLLSLSSLAVSHKADLAAGATCRTACVTVFTFIVRSHAIRSRGT